MPTIKRAQTYAEILQALETAKAKADATAPADLAFSAATLARLNTFLPLFQTEMQQMGSALGAQSAATTVVNAAQPKMKMFISHYFQVFNFGIEREVYQASDRAHYLLDINHAEVPSLRTEAEIAMWGARIISGDAARVAAGGAAMANPSAAQVAAQHAIFVAAQADQSTKKTAYDNEQEDVAEISVEGLDLANDIWDECEFTFRKESAPSKRRKCREYGVVYVPRAGETPSPDDFSMMGVITDGVTGNPIGNAAFIVQAATEIIVLTDGNGKFFVPVLPAGTYNIGVHKGGYHDYSATVVVAAGAITTRNVQLTPESVPDTGGISGTVSKAGVNILATVTVEGTTITAQTNSLGYYVLEGVTPGDVMVRATSNSNPADTMVLPITVSAGGVIELIFNLP